MTDAWAITIQQPWAWAVISGGKDTENRTRIGTWRRAVGQTVFVHAGKRISERGRSSETVREAWEMRRMSIPGSRAIPLDDPALVLGAIIGQVDVEDVHPEQGGCCQPWGEASYLALIGSKRVDIVHLELANPQPIRPYPMHGRLGLWRVDAATIADMAT